MNLEDYNSISIPQATLLQKELRDKLILSTVHSSISTIAGADISFNKYETKVYAGVVVLSFPNLIPISYALAIGETHFPYVSGYLAFREIPALFKAWELLPTKPDMLVVDGNGIVHPRRMGIASHFGIVTNQPTIGSAKTLLYGKYIDPALTVKSHTPIMDKNEQIGWVLRSKTGVAPVFVSPGHLVSIEDSLSIMTKCLGKYRIPEPTRIAHEMVNKFRTGALKEGFHVLKNRQEDNTLF